MTRTSVRDITACSLLLILSLCTLLECCWAHSDSGADDGQGKARAYHPGTKEFDDLVKSIRKGDFTQKRSKSKPKSGNSDL
jgi:hypothetical protein